jgi:hypothetical protein
LCLLKQTAAVFHVENKAIFYFRSWFDAKDRKSLLVDLGTLALVLNELCTSREIPSDHVLVFKEKESLAAA